MAWDYTPPAYRNLSSESDEWLIRELQEQIDYYQRMDSVPMAGREPGHMMQAERNIQLLASELRRRGYDIDL
ncbi:hypothetical protein FJZ33_02965 [Candidatus Poribacteria bacterium]|nr:hypothetical protein [Candidatus Poribacteria bacterium]